MARSLRSIHAGPLVLLTVILRRARNTEPFGRDRPDENDHTDE
jgi:hypothetical protein